MYQKVDVTYNRKRPIQCRNLKRPENGNDTEYDLTINHLFDRCNSRIQLRLRDLYFFRYRWFKPCTLTSIYKRDVYPKNTWSENFTIQFSHLLNTTTIIFDIL